MVENFSINDIYDKNINFLIGSGASYGLFPTLALDIKGEDEKSQTIETLATLFESQNDNSLYSLLFMHYYKSCIEPAAMFNMKIAEADEKKKEVLDNYKMFLETLLVVLLRRKNGEKNCNVFTTNYDGCLAFAADDLLQQGYTDFVLNDGAIGFSRRFLQAKNFKSYVYQMGVFEKHRADIPQINLINLHGSVYWYKDEENILVDYSDKNKERLLKGDHFKKLENFSRLLEDPTKSIDDLPTEKMLSKEEENLFWEDYKKLPIVNPTKWKFHETVFEEHYYQMLRLLSYELEKPNSVFIIFGFSFADEHILNLVKRSLSNPSLQLFVCCFSSDGVKDMRNLFKSHRNVEYIFVEGSLNFSAFNEKVFNLSPKEDEEGIPEPGA